MNLNMLPIYANDIIISVPYIGDTLHTFIVNKIPITHFSCVDKKVACIHWILLKNMCSL